MKRIVAFAALALGATALLRYEIDQHRRDVLEQFTTKFDVAARRPEEAATLPLMPAADLGAIVTTDVAIGDALGTVHLRDLTPAVRLRWLRAMQHVDDELAAARDIALDAIAVRPGWAGHWTALGELEYAIGHRAPDVPDSHRWEEPLRIGLRDFPGDDVAATFAATAYLESWPDLDFAARQRAIPEFRRALLDPAFASRAFPLLNATVGGDAAIALLPPNDPQTFRAAFESLAHAGDVERAATVYSRWESAEWSARVADLRDIEERARLNDVESQRNLADQWLSRHRPSDFDTQAGRDQVLRVLQLAVNDRVGSWQGDPRANAIRFLLNRRIHAGTVASRGIEIAPGGAVIESVVDSLSGVPLPILARAHLLGGDVDGAQAMYERSDSVGSFEWTPFVLDLIEYRLRQSSLEGANAALGTLAPGARNECDAALVRREVARFDGSGGNVAVPASQATIPPNAWSDTGVLTVCVDPDQAPMQQLMTTIDAPAPAFLAWGWNDGRAGSFYVDAGRTTFRVPLANRTGRQALFVRTLAGARVTMGTAAITAR